MKCPFCNTEMIHGYLNCGRAIWSEKKHKVTVLFAGKEERHALHLGTPITAPHNVVSDCCPNCKRIIIDSSPYKNNLGKKKKK